MIGGRSLSALDTAANIVEANSGFLRIPFRWSIFCRNRSEVPTTCRTLRFPAKGATTQSLLLSTPLIHWSGATAPLFNPRRHNWSEHFAWSHDVLRIHGLSPTGRATVDKLRLNRSGVVNLRRVLRDAGEHPLRIT